MASTTFLAYVKPTATMASTQARVSSFSAFVPIRSVSGLYGGGVQAAKLVKRLRPVRELPFVDPKTGIIDQDWMLWLQDVTNRRLGGSNYPTVPDLTQFVTLSQASNLVSTAVTTALTQQALANAQALASLTEVVKATGALGAAQVPPVQLAPAEVTPALPIEGGNGGGGGGD